MPTANTGITKPPLSIAPPATPAPTVRILRRDTPSLSNIVISFPPDDVVVCVPGRPGIFAGFFCAGLSSILFALHAPQREQQKPCGNAQCDGARIRLPRMAY